MSRFAGAVAVTSAADAQRSPISDADVVMHASVGQPVHEVIVYPMAGTNLDSPFYTQHAEAKPLNKAMMQWFYENLTASPSDMQDPPLDVVGKADLHGLAPATVITNEIDPLNCKGQALAVKLRQAGVTVNAQDYEGVTHEVFGMGLVVAKAKVAEDVAVEDLKAAFAGQ